MTRLPEVTPEAPPEAPYCGRSCKQTAITTRQIYCPDPRFNCALLVDSFVWYPLLHAQLLLRQKEIKTGCDAGSANDAKCRR